MELSKRLLNVIEQAIEENDVAGMNLLVEKDGQEICYCEAGMADREKNKPIERNTIFRLYSQSKPVTAAGAMILMERGELDLGQAVSDILPAFAQPKYVENGVVKPCTRPLRVHDLLQMTSGLAYPDANSAVGRETGIVFEEADRRLYTDNPMTTVEIANALAKCPLSFEPGTSWQYGTSADVLGAVIETVSGMKFGDFLQKELFGPLEMTDTAFWVPAQKQNRLASVYETVRDENGKKSLIRYNGNHLAIRNQMDQPPAFEAGGAGLASTLDDYRNFARMLHNGGEWKGIRILQPETVKYMTGGQLMLPQQASFDNWIGLSGYSYGNLMRVCKIPGQSCGIAKEGEYGWDGWLGCYFANFPEEKLTILFGMQKKDAGTWKLTRKLRNVILSSLL
ncbi:MAG: beta-lactamase family protein [Lachnospiraceae bacterium]|nr:beta-lactamase family protein [Lachnospiraceae bacterium]